MVAVRRAPSSAPVSKFVRLPPPVGASLLAIQTTLHVSKNALIPSRASSLLRTWIQPHEAGNGLSGQPRDLMMSVMHLVELAKAYVDKSLDGLAMH